MRNDWRRTRWGACPFCGGPDYCGYDTLSDGSDVIYCRRIFGYTGRRTAGGAFVDLNPKDVVIGLDRERYVFVKRTGQDCAMFIAEDDYAAFIEHSKEEFKRTHPNRSHAARQYDGVMREQPKEQEPKRRTWRAKKEDTETTYDRLTREQREEQIRIVDRVDRAYRTMLSKLILEVSDQERLMQKDGWDRALLSYAKNTFYVRSMPPEDFDRFNENSPRRAEYASLENIYRKKLCAEMGCELSRVPGFYRGKAGLPLICGQPGMLFPVVALYLYLCYKNTQKKAKYIFLPFVALFGVAAGLIKPTAYTCLIAIVLVEGCSFIFNSKEDFKKRAANFGVLVLSVIMAFILVNVAFKAHIYNVSGFTPDKDLEGTWSYYLNMGSNEEYMGTNNPVDSGLLVGEYSGRPGSERRAAELESFFTRTKERGIFGNLSFWNRKLTMTFNDGTFSWFREGIAAFWAGEYDDISANPHKETLRNIFWGDGEYYPYFETYAQWIWICVLVGILGVGIAGFIKGEKDTSFLLSVICIGVILFQMLFETRARYLICSLPLLILASVEGYRFYATLKYRYNIVKNGIQESEE